MRAIFIILLALLTQMGLLARVLEISPCCPSVKIETCEHHSDHNCGDEDQHNTQETCPADGVHHHHGKCMHNLMAPEIGNACHGLAPLHSNFMRHLRNHTWPPDKPFLALEKPPLI